MVFRKPARVLCIFLLCAALFAGCTANTTSSEKTAYVPGLVVTGDVLNELSLTDLSDFIPQTVQMDGQDISCAAIGDLLNAASVQGESLTVYFVSPDGVMASMPLNQAMDCYLYFSSTGWTLYAPNHPPQANIKRMSHIVVCAEDFREDERCLHIIDGDTSTTLSYGQLFLHDTVSTLVLEGEPQRQVNDKTYSVDAYTRRNLIPLFSLTGKESGTALCYLGNGAQVEVDLGGYLEWRGNSVDYIEPNRRSRQVDVIGLWLDAPAASVTDVKDLALDALKGGRVLIVEVDGLGYGACEQFIAYGCDSLAQFDIQKARTVMPSISNVALAAIVTGETPDQTGIHMRKDRDSSVPDIFAEAKTMGKTCAVIEGYSALINMSLDQTLNADTSGNGYTDDETHQSAQDAVSTGTDLIYVHYHGLDDVGHTYGPFSVESFNKAVELDTYIGELISGFSGTVILISDHGMHEVAHQDELGMHGTFMPIDMTVPLGTASY